MDVVMGIGAFIFFMLVVLLGIACLPLFDFPIPAILRQNTFLQKCLAWDVLDSHDTKFNQESLILYLKHNQKKKERYEEENKHDG